MSTKKLSIFAVICLLFVGGMANAAMDLKVGLVDKNVLIQESLYAKNVQEKMKKEFASRQEALISRERDLMSKYEDLERNRDVLAEAERNNKERDLAKMKQTLQEDSEAFQQDVMQRQEKEGAAFEKIVSEVLADIAKEEKLDLVLQQQVALFTNRKSDYTYKALQNLDKRYKEPKSNK